MEDSVPDVEDMCADLMADVELLTERVKAEGRNFNPHIEQIYYGQIAQTSGQAKASVIRGRKTFLQLLLEAPAPRVAPPSPALVAAPSAASKFAPSTALVVKAENVTLKTRNKQRQQAPSQWCERYAALNILQSQYKQNQGDDARSQTTTAFNETNKKHYIWINHK